MLPMEIEQALYGFMMSQILFAGDELGIFDNLQIPLTPSQLATILKTDPDATERLLLAAFAIGLVEKKSDYYILPNHLKDFLVKDSNSYCGGSFSHFKNISLKLSENLKGALFQERSQFDDLSFTLKENTIFSQLYSNPNSLRDFVSAMWSIGFEVSKELVKKCSLKDFNHLIDLGGCAGHFSIAALEQYPQLKATVFDLKEVFPIFEEKRNQHSLSKRLDFVAGDFFKDPLPKGDLYTLGYILSDWSRKQGTFLLKKIFNSLNPSGAVLILEKLFNEDKKGPLSTAMMNLDMLIQTYGKHHSASEYINWLNEIGFTNCQVFLSSKEKHLIIGFK